jgi:hypothetical protein
LPCDVGRVADYAEEGELYDRSRVESERYLRNTLVIQYPSSLFHWKPEKFVRCFCMKISLGPVYSTPY